MSEYATLSSDELEALKKMSTPSVCNAIETFNLQRRTEGFVKEDIQEIIRYCRSSEFQIEGLKRL